MGLRPRSASPAIKGNTDTADKAGVILGIHNVFLVLPQFIVTFLSSIIFYLMEPDKSIPAHPPAGGVIPIHNATGLGGGEDAGMGEGYVAITAGKLLARMVTSAGEGMTRWSGRSGAGAPVAGSSDAVGLIFR
jgi:solute carrier family 45 protein 1/2/4